MHTVELSLTDPIAALQDCTVAFGYALDALDAYIGTYGIDILHDVTEVSLSFACRIRYYHRRKFRVSTSIVTVTTMDIPCVVTIAMSTCTLWCAQNWHVQHATRTLRAFTYDACGTPTSDTRVQVDDDLWDRVVKLTTDVRNIRRRAYYMVYEYPRN